MMVGNNVSFDALGSASLSYIFFCIGGGSLASILLGPIWTILGWPIKVAVCTSSMIISMMLMLLVIWKNYHINLHRAIDYAFLTLRSQIKIAVANSSHHRVTAYLKNLWQQWVSRYFASVSLKLSLQTLEAKYQDDLRRQDTH